MVFIFHRSVISVESNDLIHRFYYWNNDKRETHLHLLLKVDDRWEKQLLFIDCDPTKTLLMSMQT